MRSPVISRRAVADLEAITDYLAERNPAAAEKRIAALHETFQSLASYPGIGQSLKHLRPGLHVFPARRPAQKYAIFYYVTEDRVEIVTVIHGARDWQWLLKEYPD